VCVCVCVSVCLCLCVRISHKTSAVAKIGDCLATIDVDRKVGGGCCAPSNIMSPGPRHTSVPRGILIHPPFGHNTSTLQTDRRDRTDNGPVA